MATISNTAAITFPTPNGDWSTPASVSIFDSSTTGNELFRIGLTGTVNTPANGDTVEFAASALTITIAASGITQDDGAELLLGAINGVAQYIGLLDSSNVELTGNNYARVTVAANGWTIA